MKRRNISKDLLLFVLFCALVAALTCSSAYAATVATDKLDYAPGEIVIITGSGWAPDETVTLFLHEEPIVDPNVDPDSWLEPAPIADPDGNIYTEFIVQPNDVGVTFTLTATGQTSGLIAHTIFTDSQPPCTSDADCVCNSGSCNTSSWHCTGNHLAAGTACTDDGNQCTNDVCDGEGLCAHTNKAAGVACGSPTSSDCDNADTCDGAGACLVNHVADGTACTSDGIECTTDACSSGTCAHTNKAAGVACGSPTSSDCDNADTCDGAGACQPNYVAADTPCTDEGNPCTSDQCDGAGECQHTGPNACSAVTNSSLCPFDVDTSTDVSDFRLIFTPDLSATVSKLNASNPGQFYYNVFDGAEGIGDDVTVTINIPYPFVTQGAVPIHVYDGASLDVNGCLIPGNLIDCTISTDAGNVSPSGATVILITDYNPRSFDITTPVTVACTVPDTGFLYVTLHLDYGLKGETTGCTKTIIGTSTNASCTTPTSITILDKESYVFSNSISDSDTIQSLNNFKKDPGIGGLVLENGTNDPVANVQVQICDSTNTKPIATVYTDQDGWYMWQYKYTGKAATFNVKLPGYKLSRSVTLKSNGFLVVNFTLP